MSEGSTAGNVRWYDELDGVLMTLICSLGLFVVDGIITMPIALLGFVFLPDQPEVCRAWYLSADEKAFGIKRMELEGMGTTHTTKNILSCSSSVRHKLNHTTVIGRKGRAPYTKAKIKR